MNIQNQVICIGSVLWDIIGRSDRTMKAGHDVGGRITRIPGGVAMNIAMTLRQFDVSTAVLTMIGTDDAGIELTKATQAMEIDTRYVYRRDDLSTDQYMAIEGANGLIAAIADAHSLEAAGDAILTPLCDGTLGNAGKPYPGKIALDGNLTGELIMQISKMAEFSKADLRVAPASPGKVDRLAPLMAMPNATLYVNLTEAELLCGCSFETTAAAAQKMLTNGSARVMITDGPGEACFMDGTDTIMMSPPDVVAKRITGAGDTFMAAHIYAEMRGQTKREAMIFALQTAATYVAGD